MTSKKIKTRTYLIYGIIMALLCFFCCSALVIYPFFDILSPKKVENLSQLSETENEDYINITIDNLYYTGFDYVHNNKVRAHYYYSLENDNCTFFLINAEEDTSAPQTLSNKNMTAKIISDNDLITNLTASLAKQINWTSEGLSKLTSPYLICEENNSALKNIILFIALVLFTLLTLCSSIFYFKIYFKKRSKLKQI